MSAGTAATEAPLGVRLLRALGVFVLSTALGVAGTVATAWVADTNTGAAPFLGLAHGSGILVLMAWSLAGFHIVTLAGSRLRLLPNVQRLAVLPHVAYIAAALGTFAFFTTHDVTMWLGLLASIGAIILHFRGSTSGRPVGLALAALIVSSVNVAQWLYLKWLMSTVS